MGLGQEQKKRQQLPYWRAAQRVELWRRFSLWVILFFVALLFVAQLYFALAPGKSWQQAWLSEDQRGRLLWQKKRYLDAAPFFSDVDMKAAAYYAGENFIAAGNLVANQHNAKAYFAAGAIHAHQEEYAEAIVSFRMALAMRPDWPQARHNLELMYVLLEKPLVQRDKDKDSQSDFSADDIRFDLKKQDNDQYVDDSLASGDLSQDALRKLWLRQLNRTPGQFLQRKFAYQWQRTQEKEGRD